MRDYKARIGLALIASAILLAGCIEPGGRSTEQFQKSWPAAGITQLRLDTVNGRVTIDAADQQTVNMTARVWKYSRSKRLAADYVSMSVENGVLVIRDRPMNRHFHIFFFDDSPRIDYNVTLPASIAVNATTVNGRVSVHGVDAPISLVSVNGAIDATTPTGTVEGRTVNGSVRATFTREFRGARLKTVNGSVRVTLPRDASVACDVQQVNGSFVSNIPVTVNGHGENSGAMSSGKYPLVVTTVNGSVHVTALPGTTTASNVPATTTVATATGEK